MALDLATLRKQATAAQQAGDLDVAAAGYAAFLARKPDDASVWSNLGVLHRKKGRHHMALRAQRRALALQPDSVGTQNNLANVLSDLGQYDESISLRKSILASDPGNLNHLAMVGRCLRGKGEYGAAIDHLQTARKNFPDDPELQIQLAFAQLGNGDYVAGFENYKARWRGPELAPRKMPMPEWKGEDIEGKTILVLPEQGFGDAILFARFLSMLDGQGATVKVLCEKPLLRLFSEIACADRIVTSVQEAGDADYWVNMMDLAKLHFDGVDIVPPPVALSVPDDSVARAKAIVAPFKSPFKVGVIWSGSETYKANGFRSFSHKDLLPLSDVAGVQVFSLYKGAQLADLKADGSDAFMIDAGGTDRDFADCAAMMQQMDLVVTSDTATAHLAGSLGLKVWTILHWDPFWVWRHSGDTTQWYPSMRLFRQETALEWDDVVAEATASLAKLVRDTR